MVLFAIEQMFGRARNQVPLDNVVSWMFCSVVQYIFALDNEII